MGLKNVNFFCFFIIPKEVVDNGGCDKQDSDDYESESSEADEEKCMSDMNKGQLNKLRSNLKVIIYLVSIF